MAFENLTDEEIEAGKPTKQELFRKTKDSLEDLDDRTTANENAVAAFLELDFALYGSYFRFGTLDKTICKRINFDMTIVAGRLKVVTEGTSGTTEIDLLFKRGAGPFTSLFSTRPSIAFGAGDLAISTNGVLDSGVVDLLAGDLLFLDLEASQVQGRDLVGILEYEKPA